MDNVQKEQISREWKEAKIIEKYGLQVDPTKVNRAVRKKILKNVDTSISKLVGIKNRNMEGLISLHLAYDEIEQAMKGTYSCTDNELQTSKVNQLVKRLLEVNEELTILAQYKAKANASRDARSFKPLIPDELLHDGTPTGRIEPGPDSIPSHH